MKAQSSCMLPFRTLQLIDKVFFWVFFSLISIVLENLKFSLPHVPVSWSGFLLYFSFDLRTFLFLEFLFVFFF
jgi:hypothetical protein